MLLHPPAKFNLFLAIRGRNPDGFHALETVLARLDALTDELRVEPAAAFSFECASLPAGDNTVLKAVRALEAHTGRRFKVRITLTKHIPVAAGLGGGASDAASTLLALNELEQLQLSQNELMEVATQVGMDVPFFVSGHAVAQGTHYGENIAALPSLPSDLRIQVEPGPAVLTREAFAQWDANGLTSTASMEPLLAALHAQDARAILRHLHNDFDRLPLSNFTANSLPNGAVRIRAGSGGAHVVLHVDDRTPTGTEQ